MSTKAATSWTGKRVHCIGLGGIGVSAVAKYLVLRGASVSGSDTTETDLLRALKAHGIHYWLGARPEKMGRNLDLVVYSSAVPQDDEERVRARHLNVREVSYNAFLGEITRGKKLVAVTGTHGKSTTTALLGHILIEAGLNPTIIVGSQVPTFSHGNFHNGGDDVFVVEACEHQAHFLELDPNIAVITNIDWDHPDYYKSVDHVREAMRQFVEKLPEDGVLVWNTNDAQSRLLMSELHVKPRDIGVGDAGVLRANVETLTGGQLMHVYQDDAHLSDVHLALPGEYNVENALMASAAASVLCVPGEVIARALESFRGLWRRFERIGSFQGAAVFSDYAHHPTALVRLLKAAREMYEGSRVVLVFQPHQHARTEGLFDEFVTSMDAADVLVLMEIYGVAGRTGEAEHVSSKKLLARIEAHDEARGASRALLYAKDAAEAERHLREYVLRNDLVLFVGAGDIDAFARELVSRSR